LGVEPAQVVERLVSERDAELFDRAGGHHSGEQLVDRGGVDLPAYPTWDKFHQQRMQA
jgi:hypothetical protein